MMLGGERGAERRSGCRAALVLRAVVWGVVMALEFFSLGCRLGGAQGDGRRSSGGATPLGNREAKAGVANPDGIAELHLFGIPVALNLDATPGPDGFAVRVYASGAARARGIPIRKGALEVWMFDGAVADAAVREEQPRRVWKVTPEELKGLGAITSLGLGYPLTLRWGDDRPAGDRITVVARYVAPDGAAIFSAVSSIFLNSR